MEEYVRNQERLQGHVHDLTTELNWTREELTRSMEEHHRLRVKDILASSLPLDSSDSSQLSMVGANYLTLNCCVSLFLFHPPHDVTF